MQKTKKQNKNNNIQKKKKLRIKDFFEHAYNSSLPSLTWMELQIQLNWHNVIHLINFNANITKPLKLIFKMVNMSQEMNYIFGLYFYSQYRAYF